MAYWATSWLGTSVLEVTNHETSLWAGAAICMFGAFVGRWRLAPWMLLATITYPLYRGHVPFAGAIGIGVGTTASAYLSVALLDLLKFRPSLARVQDALAFALGCVTNAVATAAIGMPLVYLAGGIAPGQFWSSFGDWGVGSMLGCIWIAPLLFVGSSARLPIVNRRRVAESLALAGLLGLFFYLFFNPDFLEVRKSLYLIRPHTLFPFFVWATLRFRQHGAATLGFVTGMVLVLAITTGNSPFDTLSVGRNFDYLQSFISMLSLTSLFLGAAVCQYDDTQVSLMVSERTAWEREREFRAVFEYSGAGHAQLDPVSGRFVQANRKMCDILGYEPEELIGKTFTEITYAADLSLSRKTFVELCDSAGRGGVDFEKRYVRKDGKVIWVSITASLIRDPRGRALSVLAVMHDVTDRKSVEDEQRQAKEAADAANLSKSQFVANMSHEIRTPLGAILGFNEFSFDPEQTPEDRLYCADKIQQNGELLRRVIDDVLDLSKMEAGRFEVQRSRFALEELLEGVHSLLQLKATEKGLKIDIRSQGRLPRFVHSDPVRLRQILINVAGNALKFTDRGSVRVVVRHLAATNDRAAMLEFEVTDTGLGMTEVQTSRIFKPFQQGDSTMTRRYGGSGLGLALARNFAQALGGELNLTKTQPGVGTTFVCRVESGAVGEQEAYEHCSDRRLTRHPGATGSGHGDRLRGRRILLADDAPDNRALISRFLEREGAIVEQAENGQEAVDKAMTTSYDLVLLDIQMPILDGIQATRLLRARGFVPPILALTAHAMREDRLRSMDAGCNDHIAKPIDPRMLVAAVERHTAADKLN